LTTNLKALLHRYLLCRDTPSTRSSVSLCKHSLCPLTLDCKCVRACDSNDVCTQDTLSRRRLLFRCQRTPSACVVFRLAAKGVNPIWIHTLRQEPPAWVGGA
jgi:hypothetical protein